MSLIAMPIVMAETGRPRTNIGTKSKQAIRHMWLKPLTEGTTTKATTGTLVVSPCRPCPATAPIVFGDLGRQARRAADRVRQVCGRSGQYTLARLIARYGRDEKLFTWTDEITANCARKQARSDSDPCGATRPDFPKGALTAGTVIGLRVPVGKDREQDR